MLLTHDNINQSGLVLEGGAMRGIFTCGVLDWMMDNNIHFPYVIGVSAGACNGASYVSNQRGRARYSNIDLLQKYKYAGFRHYLKKGNIMDFDLLFDDFPFRILPFDFEKYTHSGKRFEVVVSNCLTGKANYYEEYEDDKQLVVNLRASSSMPVFSPIVDNNGIPMLDGGVCDSIPLLRAMKRGYATNVVVLTRNKGYRKKNTGLKVPHFLFKKYPLMRDAINNRNALYNDQLELVDRLEVEKKIIVIRPIEEITIQRIEKDISKLEHFYNHGYECAKQKLSSLAIG